MFEEDEWDDFMCSIPEEVLDGSQPLSEYEKNYRPLAQTLPSEVLENIFCYLPSTDLFNCEQVCSYWCGVSANEKFMPWKKSYCMLKTTNECILTNELVDFVNYKNNEQNKY